MQILKPGVMPSTSILLRCPRCSAVISVEPEEMVCEDADAYVTCPTNKCGVSLTLKHKTHPLKVVP